MKKRWIIVSNRLPLAKDPRSGELGPSSGGLVAAITGIRSEIETLWIGAIPPEISKEEWTSSQQNSESFEKYVPIFIKKKTYEKYYNGIANQVFWPLFHYESGLVRFRWADWAAYKRVNEMFAEKILEVANPTDLVWVHDFHLFLVADYIKRKAPHLKVGFFLHIPFPSSEIFRQLPVRNELLQALLESDLIGFHDYSYLRHFCASLQSVLGLESSLLKVETPKKTVQLGVFPVSIDTKKIQTASRSVAIRKQASAYRRKQHNDYTILGVDRLDYSKGIDLKLQAVAELLRQHPELRGKASLIQICVPTRTRVPEYEDLKMNIERQVGEINGEFSEPNYVPIQYIYGSVDFQTLVALYKMARALLITSKRDGMNLVALEYIAAQNPKRPGNVLLSEFTGAVSTLSGVLPINPWDTVQTAETLAATLKSGRHAQAGAHRTMLQFLENYTATDWANSFLGSLSTIKVYRRKLQQRVEIQTRNGKVDLPDSLKASLDRKRLLVLLDYDGTLVPIHQRPSEAVLSSNTRKVLNSVLGGTKVEIVVVSGRRRNFLTEQLKDLGVSLAAEHGAMYLKKGGSHWENLVHSDKQSWYPLARKIMLDYTLRVPASFVEEKEFALSWHFRQSPTEFADYQAKKLHEELELGLANLPVAILGGKKVIEARAIEANKGTFTRWYMDGVASKAENQLVVAIGDDQTDEDMFNSVPPGSVTVKVGKGPTGAQYCLASQSELVGFLKTLSECPSS
ncbi:MAG: bifunctional alpha,alpha-trehalose-phosphate synthase (UDP-forming)/trehalose-phosphatase [Bdellovibrionales bacterium]|nr:bifunctional alpha,alpha-trehalose-phosphate synthase (UDP-forming)/trehalose-phosphatase [Bdellovibrionales bacterium]